MNYAQANPKTNETACFRLKDFERIEQLRTRIFSGGEAKTAKTKQIGKIGCKNLLYLAKTRRIKCLRTKTKQEA
jgi:hypothetical protein